MRVGGQELDRTQLPLVVRLAGVAVLYLGLAIAAAADAPLAWAALLVGIVALDLWWPSPPHLKRILRIGGLEPSALGLLQVLMFAVLLARHFADWSAAEGVSMALLVLLPLSRAAYLLCSFAWRVRFLRPIAVRNIDLGPLVVSTPNRFSGWGEARLVRFGAVPLLAGAIGIAFDQVWPFIVVAVGYVLVVLLATAGLAARVAGWGGAPSNSQWQNRALQRIRGLEPEVLVHFSGSPDAAYQLNMWLEPLAALNRPTLIILRERAILNQLPPTELAVACMPDSVTVMSAKLASARVAFYMAHTGKNIHLLREPSLRHVFIGHGDSDKVSSINPFAKAYDELWVAGPAARQRWADANVGIRDESVVEVGRPQLVQIERGDAQEPVARRRVLYAPTWEGWTDADFGTSITDMGPVLIEGLLAASPAWEIVYKPHPFTGMRDPRTRKAHHVIVDLLQRANGSTSPHVETPRLAALKRQMQDPRLSTTEHQRLVEEWNTEYWAAHNDGAHLVVDESLPTLFACFNHCDLMIADVSSVVSDFLASGKPYVCANPRGQDPDQFLRENPTTGGAYLLNPDCLELPDILTKVRSDDPLQTTRHQLREHILGPTEPPSIERWRSAVDRLAATANVGATSDPDPDLMDAEANDAEQMDGLDE